MGLKPGRVELGLVVLLFKSYLNQIYLEKKWWCDNVWITLSSISAPSLPALSISYVSWMTRLSLSTVMFAPCQQPYCYVCSVSAAVLLCLHHVSSLTVMFAVCQQPYCYVCSVSAAVLLCLQCVSSRTVMFAPCSAAVLLCLQRVSSRTVMFAVCQQPYCYVCRVSAAVLVCLPPCQQPYCYVCSVSAAVLLCLHHVSSHTVMFAVCQQLYCYVCSVSAAVLLCLHHVSSCTVMFAVKSEFNINTTQALLNDPKSDIKKALYINSRKTVQRELRQMQDVWYSKKADEIQSYADSNNMKDFYASLKSVYGPQPSGSSPLLSSDGNSIITDRSKILDRWAEHFQAVLNCPSNINDEAINWLKQTPINIALADPPQSSEVKKAISKLSSGKAPGQDCIPAEIYVLGSPLLIDKLTELFCWNVETRENSPRAQGCLNYPPLLNYKKKGNRQSCDNHRGISLFVHSRKNPGQSASKQTTKAPWRGLTSWESVWL